MNEKKPIKLVCFDVDGTIIHNIEFIWKTLHENLGTANEEREQYKEDFFSGKITFQKEI